MFCNKIRIFSKYTYNVLIPSSLKIENGPARNIELEDSTSY